MKYIRTYKTLEDYNIEQDTLVKPNLSLVSIDNSLHYNENYFELVVESIGDFKIPIYFTKSDYSNNSPSIIMKGTIGVTTVKFNHKIYNIQINKDIFKNVNIKTIIVKGDLENASNIIYSYKLYNNINIDITKLNKNSLKIIDYMFHYYSSNDNEITNYLDVTNLCTKNINSLNSIFNGCNNLKHIIGLLTWNTINVTEMTGTFMGCRNLDNINDVENWNVENVIYMNSIFYFVSSDSIDLKNWITKSITSCMRMFYNSFKTIYGLENWDVSKCTNFDHMFYYNNNYRRLTYINVSTWNMENAINVSYMFYNYIGTILDLSKWHLPNAIYLKMMMFSCNNLALIDAHNWNPKLNTTLDNTFAKSTGVAVSNIKTIDVSNWDNDELLSMNNSFYDQNGLTSINFTNFKTPKVTSMQSTFTYLTSITELNCSSFITRYVTNMNNMFKDCINLIKLNICNFDTTSLISMSNMFSGCTALNQLIIGINFFNSLSLTIYSFKSLTNWTESSSLAILVDAIPITVTPKILEISINTSNTLTNEQKASIVDKNWTISVF